MIKKKCVIMGMLFLGLLLAVPTAWAQEGEGEGKGEGEKKDWNKFQVNEDVSISLNGYLYMYHIRNNNAYHTNANAAWTEISAGLGMDFDFRQEVSGQFRAVGTGLFGRPENYLYNDPDVTGDMETMMDLATIFEIGGQDSKYISISNTYPLDFDMNKVGTALRTVVCS